MARKIGFGDKSKMTQGRGNVKRYKGQNGVTDVISLVDSKPVLIASHYVEDLNRGFTCAMEWDEDKEKYTGKCPLCEEGNKRNERFCLKIVHILRDKETVGKIRLWQFGGDKYQLLSAIDEEYDMDDINLKITCTEEKYQRLNILPTKSKGKVPVDKESDFDLDKFVSTPSYEQVATQLKEARNGTETEVFEVSDEPAAKKKADADDSGDSPPKRETAAVAVGSDSKGDSDSDLDISALLNDDDD